DGETVGERLHRNIKSRIGILTDVEIVPPGELGRTEKKSRRVFDRRYE
ncbi:MAG: phenylacetate--CoA ligase family protein, partial [Desulfitobacteriaceae bacterium]|nr:phenylacetate--CoA ligase family protein [Desulfitobacteriaceae bacterium]